MASLIEYNVFGKDKHQSLEALFHCFLFPWQPFPIYVCSHAVLYPSIFYPCKHRAIKSFYRNTKYTRISTIIKCSFEQRLSYTKNIQLIICIIFVLQRHINTYKHFDFSVFPLNSLVQYQPLILQNNKAFIHYMFRTNKIYKLLNETILKVFKKLAYDYCGKIKQLVKTKKLVKINLILLI